MIPASPQQYQILLSFLTTLSLQKVLLQVPDFSVAAIIGKQGVHVRSMSDEFGLSIVVESRQEDKEQRIVTMEGPIEKIFEAIKKIMVCVERMENKSKDKKFEEKTTAKFVFPEKAMGFMIGKRGYFIQDLNAYHGV
jgi:predicted PilT family ATPase